MFWGVKEWRLEAPKWQKIVNIKFYNYFVTHIYSVDFIKIRNPDTEKNQNHVAVLGIRDILVQIRIGSTDPDRIYRSEF